jgi:two-component system, OmpR family, sensor kinase
VSPRPNAAPRPWSISRRLISRLTIALAAIWLIAVVIAAAVVNEEINEVFDSALQETAQRLLPLVAEELEEQRETSHERESSLVIADDHEFGEHEEYLIYQVRDAAGKVLLRSHDAPEQPLPLALQRGHSDVEGLRIFTETDRRNGLYIHVGDSAAHRREAVLETLASLAAPLGLLLPLAGLLIFWTVRRSLAPVDAVRADLAARGGGDLSPIVHDALPEELAPIVEDVNHLLDRLGQALESERAFAANSAHELRTPVAAALAQTQRLAVELRDTPQQERTARIAATLHRLGDLVEKLLQLARAEAGIALSRDPLDVLPALRLVVEEFTRRGDVGARLHFDAGGHRRLPARIDIDAFGILLRNLVDNALHHGAEGGEVAVFIDPAGAIHVVNGGTVVPAERLARLTQRFERAGSTTPGAGLGLAIVETILAQSGGKLELRSPAAGRTDGFEAVLRLDLCEGSEVQPGA